MEEHAKAFAGCPGTAIREIEREDREVAHCEAEHRPSTLRNFPFQLALVPPTAPFLKEANLVLSADCVPFAYASFPDCNTSLWNHLSFLQFSCSH
jgi:hypothetical protein